jgi:hypothetical protein
VNVAAGRLAGSSRDAINRSHCANVTPSSLALAPAERRQLCRFNNRSVLPSDVARPLDAPLVSLAALYAPGELARADAWTSPVELLLSLLLLSLLLLLFLLLLLPLPPLSGPQARAARERLLACSPLRRGLKKEKSVTTRHKSNKWRQRCWQRAGPTTTEPLKRLGCAAANRKC